MSLKCSQGRGAYSARENNNEKIGLRISAWRIPRKLKHDAIIEALLEIRFDMAATIPEVFFGRLVDHVSWKGFEQRRLPAYQVPAALRQADANWRYSARFRVTQP